MASQALVQKLEKFVTLSEDDRTVLHRLSTEKVRQLPARMDVIREGDTPREVFLILSGWTFRYKQLQDGRRQIVAFFLPGDLCDLNVFILRQMDHSVATLTPVKLAHLSRQVLGDIAFSQPRVAQALWWESLVHMAIQREWTLSLGQRSAYERIAHLFCELYIRLSVVGLVSEGRCDFPLTQPDIADAMGILVVHVNRTLQELRADGLITLRERVLTEPQLDALMAAGTFSPNYLHLSCDGMQLDADA